MSPNDTPAGRPSGAGKGGDKAAKPGKTDAKGGKPVSGTSQRRMSREAALALVLLPVLLVAGFLLGGQLLSDDDAALDTATQADRTAGPSETTEPADTGVDETPVAGPTVPEATETAPEPTAPEPTTPEPTAPDPTTPEPTTPDPTTPEPTTPEPTTPAPAPEPAEEPAAEEPPAPAAPAPATGTPPPFSNPAVTVFGPGQVSDDIRTWQARMAERGWHIEVDGIYGPQTRRIAMAFQAEKGLVVDGLVGPATWAAAWTAPVT